MSTIYEWDVETIDTNGDIIDHHFQPSLQAAIAFAGSCPEATDIVLVRSNGNDDDGLLDRQWAYLVDGWTLGKDGEFDGGWTIPKRFLAEVSTEAARHGCVSAGTAPPPPPAINPEGFDR